MKPHCYNLAAEMLQLGDNILSVAKFHVRSGCVCAKSAAHDVFAPTIFGKGDKLQLLLEDAVQEAHESIRLTVELMMWRRPLCIRLMKTVRPLIWDQTKGYCRNGE